MKNLKQSVFFCMVAIIALGFGFVGCDDGNGDSDKDLTGNITISHSGTELTANYSGSETVNYQWKKDGTDINGKTAQKYTLTEAGSYTVTINATGYNSKTSENVLVNGYVTDNDNPSLNVPIYQKTGNDTAAATATTIIKIGYGEMNISKRNSLAAANNFKEVWIMDGDDASFDSVTVLLKLGKMLVIFLEYSRILSFLT